jgi:two-component system, OmpR family, sensor histidine kinase CiaH
MANNNIEFRKKLKIKRPLTIYILYWILLSYILAALVFWFSELNRQNIALSHYRLDMIDVDDAMHLQKLHEINDAKDRKTAQYVAEGIAFLLLMSAGAIFVFRAMNNQINQSLQQENFMMAITHELKTPIAITKLNLETLQKRVLSDKQQQKLITITIQEANRLNALCNNMLLTTQIEAGGYKTMNESIDIAKLARECVHNFTLRYPNRKIETQVTGEIFIKGDMLLLELAVNNLLDNAIKYSGKEDIVLLKMFQAKKLTHVQVIDEGPGIPDADKQKIFEKYFRRSQEQAKGTGLGLYLAKKIAKVHNGDIVLSDNISHGCIFDIILKEQKKSSYSN